MQTKVILLPALAALCLGAPIPEPQLLGGGTAVSTRGPAQQTYTFVIPCFGAADCVPKTMTVAAQPAMTNFPRDPQVLGSPSRTVIVGPTPPATTKKTTSKKPVTTQKPHTTQKPYTTKKPTSTKRISSTKKHNYRTVELEKRQSLGEPSRTVLGWPSTWPSEKPPVSSVKPSEKPPVSSVKPSEKPPVSSVKPSGKPPVSSVKPPVSVVTVTITSTAPGPQTTRVTSEGDGSSRTASSTLVVPLDKRQVLGSPSRTVLESPSSPAPPPPPPHPYPTSIKTVTYTVTYYPPIPPTTTVKGTKPVTSNTSDYYSRSTEVDGGITRTISTTLVVPIEKRQTLLPQFSTVLAPVPTTVATTKVSFVTVTVPTTIRTTVYQASDFSVTTTERIISVSTATVRKSVTQTLTKSAISTLTTTTCTEKFPSTTIWDSSPTGGPTGWDITRTASAILTVPVSKRQEFGGGIPSFSFSWYTAGEAAPTDTPLEVNPRQVLGFPSRSFTFYGSLPTNLPTKPSIPTDLPAVTRTVL